MNTPVPSVFSRLLFPSLLAAACAAQQAPASRVVSLGAPDGTILKGTFFASSKPGPGVLLLHQCNQQRKLWDPLGERLASFGVSVLTLDYRGFGESGGTPHDKLAPQERNRIETEIWPGDIEAAFQYLLSQPGVTRDRIGAGGASCGVGLAIKLARRHPELKSLALLAGPTDREGRQFLQSSNLPVFTSAADDDIFGPQSLAMQWFFSLSRNPFSRFAHYATGGHGAEMFAVHKELPQTIAEWFVATLTNKPAMVPKTNGSPLELQVMRALESIDRAGGAGAADVAQTMSTAREHDPKPKLFPEYIVNILGYEHLQLGDTKGAVAILKLNAVAYPDSPNVYDSLSDACLADGQKDLALQNAKKALELLANNTALPEPTRNAIRESSEQKIRQLTAPAHP